MFFFTKKLSITTKNNLQIGCKIRNILIYMLIIVIVLLIACENPITGFGPQPLYFDKHVHKPMLNVFGVLRPGNLDGKPLSFVHLEESFPITTSPDTIVVSDAKVTLFKYEKNIVVDSLELSYTNLNSTFPISEYRHIEFFPMEGVTYGVSCVRNGFPKLTSKTTIPSTPKIVDNSIHSDENKLTFSILRDSLAALYDIYLIVDQETISKRIRRPEAGNIRVIINFNQTIESQGLLLICAYDLQLSEYITYNVSIKPNTYRSNYSTVENGFGCFGSLNILEEVIIF